MKVTGVQLKSTPGSMLDLVPGLQNTWIKNPSPSLSPPVSLSVSVHLSLSLSPHLFLGLLHQGILVSTGVKLSQQVRVDELLRLRSRDEVT